MKKRGLRRLKGNGCNNSLVKRRVRDWKKRYDLSGGYGLKTDKRIKGAE